MPKIKMLIEESRGTTKVALLRDDILVDYTEDEVRRGHLRGNIYKGIVSRIEPSLQAAFVEYGGNRHGFLAFSEIHPDYYQIPVADRQALLEAEAEDARLAQEEEDDEGERKKPRRRRSRQARAKDDKIASEAVDEASGDEESEAGEEAAEAGDNDEVQADAAGPDEEARDSDDDADGDDEDEDEVDTVAEDAEEEATPSAPKPRKRAPRKVYKIQEVIKRRQVLLIQVVKEERGNKGAALTTYLSLAGRYCVLMPNTARGGGISRKIADPADRRRLKDVIKEIDVPEGMGLIVRTAGAQRTKTEIKRDYDYLLRMWESVRELTLKSSAPKLVYEEGDLIKRSIRDLYSKDIDEVLVEGEEGYKEAKDFMKMLMPSHARNVKLYKDTRQLFTRYQVESQLDGLFTPTVTLPSGGYIVMNQTEALVSIDINSGKATREHNIEDTALKTNLEAAVEIARQLRLRDLAGLIVIDFIDMEENRNNRAVERKLKDALKNDRARIQVGRISHFGLLEMSRQRLRQGMMESSTRQCPHCEGTGVIRAVSSCALSVLRGIEEHLLSRKAESLDVRVHPDVAIYIFNEKREALLSLEQNYGISIWIIPDRECAQAESRIERKPERKGPAVRPVASATAVAMGDEMEAVEEEPVIDDEEDEEEASASADAEARGDEDGEPRKKRRRRRGRRGGRRQREERQDGEASEGEELAAESDTDEEGEDTQAAASGEEAQDGEGNGEQRKKRRRRRGGRGRGAKSAEAGEEAEAAAEADAGEDAVAAEAEEPEAEPAEAVAEEAPAEEEKPAKKPRKRAAKKAAAADAAEAETVSADADEEAKPAKKPRKRAAKKAVEAEQHAEPEAEKPASSNGGQRPEPEEPAKPELVAAEEPAAPRWQPPAPTVDPSTAPKKSGWWGKRS